MTIDTENIVQSLDGGHTHGRGGMSQLLLQLGQGQTSSSGESSRGWVYSSSTSSLCCYAALLRHVQRRRLEGRVGVIGLDGGTLAHLALDFLFEIAGGRHGSS